MRVLGQPCGFLVRQEAVERERAAALVEARRVEDEAAAARKAELLASYADTVGEPAPERDEGARSQAHAKSNLRKPKPNSPKSKPNSPKSKPNSPKSKPNSPKSNSTDPAPAGRFANRFGGGSPPPPPPGR